MLPVVILAGGLATRLHPVTLELPKSLIDIDGFPFIHHQLLLLREKGVTQVILCVGHLGEQIESYVGDGSRYGIDVRYSYDGDHLLGTGGAVKKASSQLSGACMILYGDSYLDVDYREIGEFFFKGSQPVLMTIYHNQNTLDSSNIRMINGTIEKYEKGIRDPSMEYVDYGLIVIQIEVFDRYPSSEPFDLSTVLSTCVDSGEVTAYEVRNRFYEIGSVQGMKETADYIRLRAKE